MEMHDELFIEVHPIGGDGGSLKLIELHPTHMIPSSSSSSSSPETSDLRDSDMS